MRSYLQRRQPQDSQRSSISAHFSRPFQVVQAAHTDAPIDRQAQRAQDLKFDQAMMNLSIQPKVTIGQPNDQYEQEADRVAAQVVAMPNAQAPVQRQAEPEEDELQMKPLAQSADRSIASTITPLVQREMRSEEEEPIQEKALVQREEVPEEEEEPIQAKSLVQREKVPEEEDELIQEKALVQREEVPEEEEEPIQAKAASGTASLASGTSFESALGASKSGGSPLPDSVRSFMEPRFGADFSGVRVHTGEESVQMSRAIGAQAFTHGNDVYFGAGKAPGNDELTAHELTHVVQQSGRGRQSIQRDISFEIANINYIGALETGVLESFSNFGNLSLPGSRENQPKTRKTETVTVSVTKLNVRQAPSLAASKLGFLSQGEQVEVIGKKGKWLNVIFQGMSAFIHGDYVQPKREGAFKEIHETIKTFGNKTIDLLTPPSTPPWIGVAESQLGTKEIKGKKHNPVVLQYHATTTLKATDDETPWCSSFVNWVMQQSGRQGTNSAMALSWKSWGQKLTKPAYGSIAVFDWGGNKGHVGFIVGKSGDNLIILGGNQKNEVNKTSFSANKVIAYVMPTDYQVPASAYEFEPVQAIENSKEGNFSDTR
jgi:uncharacterized protein (TIGR02594 family)